MRQFLFGLLVAAGLWWGWSAWTGDAAESKGRDGAPPGSTVDPAAVAPVDMGRLLREPPPVVATSALDTRRADTPAVPGLDELLARIGRGEPEAVAIGWAAVATTRAGEERQKLVASLSPATVDFSQLLASLGANNAFLHSAEGRVMGTKALAAAMALPDNDAALAGSQLVGLALRGRVERVDTEARQFVDDAYRQHRIRVERWICDPANVARARSYTVVKGDSLARIAGKFRRDGVLVEDGTLAVVNRIHNPNSLQVGQKIKVPVDPIAAVVEKRSYSLSVYVGDYLLRMYWVGHGENDKTPVTEFIVSEKQPKPEWTAPDGNRYPYGHPKNILGEYFIKFRHERYTGFGAHGTPMPETIGTMSSMGCIRMLGPDIAELFQILPRGAKVVVRASLSVVG